jgi:type I restriction enzyme, S subunit
MSDLNYSNEEELIDFCIKNSINYFNSRKKENYKKNTIVKNIKKFLMEKSETTKETTHVTEEIKNVEYYDDVIWKLEDVKNTNDNYSKIKGELTSVIKKCHQILYSTNSIVGILAQNDIMKIFTIIILQNQFIKENESIVKKCEDIKPNIKEEKYNKYISYAKNLSLILEESNLLNEWKMFINKFMSVILPSIYSADDITFNTKSETDIRMLISTLSKINIDNDFIDAFATSYGDIHELFREYGGGKGAKELGQFFTPRHLIHSILHGCGLNDIIKSYDNPSIYDCCMGTGGLLCRAYANGNINPNNIYGCEFENNTIKFGECSIILETNTFNSNLVNCDSLCKNPYLFTNKFDIIFTNPPFGTSIKYDDLKTKFNNFKEGNYEDSVLKFQDIYPISMNNGAGLFIQHCIYMLKDGGTCAIVLPDGNLMIGKQFIKLRKYIAETVKLQKIIKVESGSFEHTTIKTCVLIFKKEGKTDNVDFLEINKNGSEVKLIGKCFLNKNYEFDLPKIKEEQKKYDGVEIKTLGEVCDIENGKRIVKKEVESGDYPVYGSGEASFTTNIFNREGFNIIVGRFALSSNCVKLLNNKIFLNDSGFSIKFKNQLFLNKYLGYFLINNQKNIYNCSSGVAQKNINFDEFNLIKIPIPSIEKQEEIVKDLDILTENINTIKLRLTQLNFEKELLNKSALKQFRCEETEIKTLGEVCEYKSGKRLPQGHNLQNDKTPYPYIRITDIENNSISLKKIKYISQKTKDIINKYIITTNDIYITIAGTTGLVGIIPNELEGANLTENAIKITIINKNEILQKYLLYNLYYCQQENLKNKTSGLAIPKLSIEKLMTLKIPIPSIEKQEEIVKYFDEEHNKNLEKINEMIKKEEEHIEFLNKIAQDLF